jgi:hypothetical protein
MRKFTSAEGLAKALEENDWVASKTTEKTMAIMAGLDNIPWDKVKLFTLRWEFVGGEIVPNINLMMYGEEVESEVKIDVEIPDEEEI